MAWESSRPVPWRRLIREWMIYAAIMAAIFLIFVDEDNLIGAMVGLLISGPLYLVFGSVLAKFGYQRKSMKQLRAERADRADSTDGRSTSTSKATSTATDAPRQRPAPTRRTSGGGRANRPGNRRR